MNLLDLDLTSPAAAFAAVEAEARQRGIGIDRSEIVGLIPERGLLEAGAASLKMSDAADHLLEAKIRSAEGPTLNAWLDELAAASPVPGGGSAAALAGVLAGALVAMGARLTIGRKAYAAAEPRAREILAEAETLRGELRRLVDDDAAAYTRVSDAYKIPKDNPSRGRAIDAALLGASQTPLEAARRAERLIRLAREIATIGNKNARSDALVAEGLARAALAGALENVRINVASLSDGAPGRRLLEEAERLGRHSEGQDDLGPSLR
jgi:glutamate formiminotransferase/formiminotetrahydrofolate cyclodeaminase